MALALGKTVKELLGDMAVDELSYWECLNELNPIGRWKNDFNHAQLCSTIANWSGLASEAVAPKDYFWNENPEPEKPTPEQLQQKIIRAFGLVKP